MCLTRNQVCQKWYRGFKSLLLRHSDARCSCDKMRLPIGNLDERPQRLSGLGCKRREMTSRGDLYWSCTSPRSLNFGTGFGPQGASVGTLICGKEKDEPPATLETLRHRDKTYEHLRDSNDPAGRDCARRTLEGKRPYLMRLFDCPQQADPTRSRQNHYRQNHFEQRGPCTTRLDRIILREREALRRWRSNDGRFHVFGQSRTCSDGGVIHGFRHIASAPTSGIK